MSRFNGNSPPPPHLPPQLNVENKKHVLKYYEGCLQSMTRQHNYIKISSITKGTPYPKFVPARDPKQCGGVGGYCMVMWMMMMVVMMNNKNTI